jgi:peptide/nickel transport system permease protein
VPAGFRPALGALLLLAGTAAWAPCLANDRPLWIEAVDHGAYERAAGELVLPLSALVGLLEGGELAYLERRGSAGRAGAFARALAAERDAARLRSRTLQRYLPPSARLPLLELERKIDACLAAARAGGAAAGVEPARAALAAAEELQDALRARPGPDGEPPSVGLVPAGSSPVLESLDGLDAAAALACSFALLLVCTGSRSPRTWLAAAMIALCGGAVVELAALPGAPGAGERDWKRALAEGELAVERLVLPPLAWGPAETDLSAALCPPSWGPAGGEGPSAGAHALGTDALGRDILARVIWGGRASLAVGVASAALLLAVGVAVGALAGFHGGRVDLALSRSIEVFQCFPAFFLIVTAAALIPERRLHPLLALVLAIALVNWTWVARLVRAEFLRAREQDYVAAARSLGFSSARIAFGHVLPNVIGPVQVAAAFAVASGVLIESGVSFLGFGVRPPMPSWGALLGESRSLEHWWLVVFPGLAIFATVLATYALGESLRGALDPRESRGAVP